MKVIFFDVDGVLNSHASFKRIKRQHLHRQSKELRYDSPDPRYMASLNKIIRATKAKVILSSTWRTSGNTLLFQRYFDLLGFRGDIIDKTPKLDSYRGTEIACWLMEHKSWLSKRDPESSWDKWKAFPVESFVILDDDRDMEHLSPFLVHVKGGVGLHENHVRQAIEILNTTKNPYI